MLSGGLSMQENRGVASVLPKGVDVMASRWSGGAE